MRRDKTRSLLVGLIAALLLLITGCSSGFNAESDSSEPSMETVANPTGVTAAKPMDATQADRMTLPVRGDSPIDSWADLDKKRRNDPTYVSCLEQTLGVNWDTDVPRFIDIENKRSDGGVTIILANNVKHDIAWIRAFAKAEDDSVNAKTPVVFTSGFKNTRDGDCVPFIDKRSIIRVAEAVPTGLNKNGKPYIGPDDEIKGVLDRCNNPFTVPFTPSSPSPSASDSTSPSASSSPSPSGSTSSPPGTPGTPTPSPETKIPSQDPGPQNNGGNGTGTNEDTGPGDKTTPSQPGNAPREDPPAPEADKPKAPVVTSTPRPSSSPTPTVDPDDQDNDGVVDPDDCAIC